MNTKKLTVLSFLVALAMILSFVESQIPSPVVIPGAKIGLANIVAVYALYHLSMKEALIVSAVRVFLLSVLFGTFVSFAYSISGALLSLVIMVAMKKTDLFSCLGVSVAGAVSHNVGQIVMACLLLGTAKIAYYLPYLLFAGIGSGIVIGLLAAQIIKRISV